MLLFFFFNDTATTEIYTLSLHDALPIFQNMDLDCAISKADTEELGFEFLETLFILHYLLPFRGNLLLCTFSVDFLPSAVVFGFEVGRAKVLRAVYVPAQSAEHVHIVAPKGNICYIVAVADCKD